MTKVLYCGFDGLDVAFMGRLAPAALSQLEDAKAAAIANNEAELIELGPGRLKMHVAQTGSRGGYAFRCDTGEDGEVWFFKRSTSFEDWNIRVSMKSLAMATLGLQGAIRRLYERLEAMGASVMQESVSRVDICMDFINDKFRLDPAKFVAHWRARRAVHATAEAKTVGSECVVHYSGREVSSVTVGTMPNRQVIIYDKRREAIDRGKKYWFTLWGIEKDDADHVWRIELRAGKNYLTDFGIKTFGDLQAMVADVMRETLQNVRMVQPGRDRNVSRARVHPIWRMAADVMPERLDVTPSGVLPSQLIAGRREAVKARYAGQMLGMLAGFTVTENLAADHLNSPVIAIRGRARRRLMRELIGVFNGYLTERSEPFAASQKRARKRMVFLMEEKANEHGGPVASPA